MKNPTTRLDRFLGAPKQAVINSEAARNVHGCLARWQSRERRQQATYPRQATSSLPLAYAYPARPSSHFKIKPLRRRLPALFRRNRISSSICSFTSCPSPADQFDDGQRTRIIHAPQEVIDPVFSGGQNAARAPSSRLHAALQPFVGLPRRRRAAEPARWE
jgi:hypothetical protein